MWSIIRTGLPNLLVAGILAGFAAVNVAEGRIGTGIVIGIFTVLNMIAGVGWASTWKSKEVDKK